MTLPSPRVRSAGKVRSMVPKLTVVIHGAMLVAVISPCPSLPAKVETWMGESGCYSVEVEHTLLRVEEYQSLTSGKMDGLISLLERERTLHTSR
ncbi:hypothetical protein QJS10_CPB11g01180 [Acorus calamus]|uniref:Uncharacterized protein n=1 Tax=Acorus calamus TaxID=4465 RepID=A0AAV9DTB6_ACOCL|nr:hypothetical protein QJS10_CPB11g01180 [Acorus calamus]